MLDLSKIKKKAYEIKLEDGTILKIKRPTQGMLLNMMKLSQTDGNADAEIITELFKTMLVVFNHNENGIKFSEEEIADMLTVDIAVLVLKDYLRVSFEEVGK